MKTSCPRGQTLAVSRRGGKSRLEPCFSKKRSAKAKGCLALYSPTGDVVPCETKNSARQKPSTAIARVRSPRRDARMDAVTIRVVTKERRVEWLTCSNHDL